MAARTQAGIERRRARQRARYHARRAAGLCTQNGCDDPPESPGMAYCAVHGSAKNAAAAAWRAANPRRCNTTRRRRHAARLASGTCTRCSAPVLDGRAKCARCAAIESAALRDRYHARRDAGLCAWSGCREPPEAGGSQCADHMARSATAVTRSRERAVARATTARIKEAAPPPVRWQVIEEREFVRIRGGPLAAIHAARNAARSRA